MDLSRRELLLKTLFGSGLLGLRSLATGLPLSFFLDPRKAMASGTSSTNAQYLILSTSGRGDPVNANVPGTYGSSVSGVVHPVTPAMAPTTLTLSGQATTAAAPWASLPQNVLDRTCFFHHGTYTVVHGDELNVLKLMGTTLQSEMIPSIYAKQLGPILNTVQTQPVALAGEEITFNARPQPYMPPTALAQILGAPTGPLGTLQSLRDRDLDRINAIIRARGNMQQKAYIDEYANSQRQAREISQSLLSSLTAIKDNSQDSQVAAAVILIQMNVAPVVTLHLNFGDDNHTDTGYANETTQTVASVSSIATLMQLLTSAGIQDRVTFASLNVFGRTLTTSDGRAHHGDHHCTVIIGEPFRGGIVGGIEPANMDYRAMSIDSSTGTGVPMGDGNIPFSETLTSMAKTLGTGLGVDATTLDADILGGTVISPALSA